VKISTHVLGAPAHTLLDMPFIFQPRTFSWKNKGLFCANVQYLTITGLTPCRVSANTSSSAMEPEFEEEAQ
jgi:hypothetical protein